VPTNKQRRDAQRRHLERQLQRRREREVRRRKTNLVLSIVGTLVLIGAIVLTVVLISNSDDKKKPAGNDTNTSLASTPPSTTASTPSAPPSTSYAPAAGAAVTFDGVTVKGAADLNGYPVVSSKETTAPKKIEVKDLVVGKGTAAKEGDSVTVQYYGVLYKDGTYFDSSWKRGSTATFAIKTGPGGVIAGFATGIGGGDGIAPMKVGGRRVIIVPWADGYGAAGSPPAIPAKADLVFVVDLKALGGG
jgi:hypothetical protein